MSEYGYLVFEIYFIFEENLLQNTYNLDIRHYLKLFDEWYVF